MNIFYYDKKQLLMLCTFNAVLLFGIIMAEHYFPSYSWLYGIVAVLCFVSLSSSLYVTIFPQQLACISDKGIIIDNHEILKWSDVKFAKKLKPSKFSLRTIIVFTLNNEKAYNLSFMQKLCAKSTYGAFSIPLYAMNPKDQTEIESKISEYIKIDEI